MRESNTKIKGKHMTTTLTTHQQEVYEAIVGDIQQNLSSIIRSNNLEDHFLSLSGPAGVGKSHLTTQILKGLMNSGTRNICVTAPTNKAVKVLKDMIEQICLNVDCRTIHSFLNIRSFKNYNTGEEKFKVQRTKNSLPEASLLIIDESSMISEDLYCFIIEAFNRGQINTVLFIGDPYQLLPVNQGENAILKLKRQYKLTEIVRQAKESNIIKLATKIRECIQKQSFINLNELLSNSETDDIKLFRDRMIFVDMFYKNDNWWNDDKILTTYTNKDVNNYNNHIRNRFWKEQGLSNAPYMMTGDILRFKSSLEDTGRDARIRNPVTYQNGDEVKIATATLIQREGAPIKYWQCTAVGRTEKEFFRVIDSDSFIPFNEALNQYAQLAKTAQFPYHRQYWKMYYELKNSFADVQYIYASTIHKLQGSTYDTIYIDISKLLRDERISNDLKFRLLYVAITRARSEVNLLI